MNDNKSYLDEKTNSLNQSGTFLQFHILNELTRRDWDTEVESPRIIAPFITNPIEMRDLLYRSDPNRLSAEKFPEAVRRSQDFSNKVETSLDIYAGKYFRTISDEFRLRLCVEAKKNDPRFNDWCFFQLNEKTDLLQTITSSIRNEGTSTLMHVKETTRYGNDIFVQINKFPNLPLMKFPISDFAIALKNKKVETDYYKSEKNVIDNSTRQIIRGTYSTIIEHVVHQVVSGEGYTGFPDIFIPIMVTNANLFLCKFDVKDIDSKSAQITKDPKYIPINGIIYEYPKPKEVEFPEPLSSDLDPVRRKEVLKWHVLILNPKGFVDFLDNFENLPKPMSD